MSSFRWHWKDICQAQLKNFHTIANDSKLMVVYQLEKKEKESSGVSIAKIVAALAIL